MATRAKPRGRNRRYWVGSALYVIRDTFYLGMFWGCEYAQRNANGSTKWVYCAEGAEFSDIAPLRFRGFL